MQLDKPAIRFLYLNTYAILLSVIGVGISVIPLYKVSWYLLIVQVPAVFFTLRGAIVIFASWQSKKRSYRILVKKNKDSFRPDSFKDYMEAPCGRLLTKLVLKDLHMEEHYAEMKRQYPMTFFEDLKHCNTPDQVEVYFNENYQFNA